MYGEELQDGSLLVQKIGFIFRVKCFQGSTLAFLVASRHGERLSYKVMSEAVGSLVDGIS